MFSSIINPTNYFETGNFQTLIYSDFLFFWWFCSEVEEKASETEEIHRVDLKLYEIRTISYKYF